MLHILAGPKDLFANVKRRRVLSLVDMNEGCPCSRTIYFFIVLTRPRELSFRRINGKIMSPILRWEVIAGMAMVTLLGMFLLATRSGIVNSVNTHGSLLATAKQGPTTFAMTRRKELFQVGLEYVGDYEMQSYLTQAKLLLQGYNAKQAIGTPRIAFLFIVRREIHHEPLWQRFFQNHEDKYSLYVHSTPDYMFPSTSIFQGKQIPMRADCPRYSRALLDAIRRLFAYALLDPRYNNMWFLNACETTIPLRSFPYVYDYLMRSPLSFVESFYPDRTYHTWDTSPEFNRTELRKGELWMAIQRHHARIVIGDSQIYFKFVKGCLKRCTWDEQYIQTLLSLSDPAGIANRTVFYVDWTPPHGGSPRPLKIDRIQDYQSRTWDSDGERRDTAFYNTTYSCVHNGVVGSPCFLFARKFVASTTQSLLALSPKFLGY